MVQTRTSPPSNTFGNAAGWQCLELKDLTGRWDDCGTIQPPLSRELSWLTESRQNENTGHIPINIIFAQQPRCTVFTCDKDRLAVLDKFPAVFYVSITRVIFKIASPMNS